MRVVKANKDFDVIDLFYHAVNSKENGLSTYLNALKDIIGEVYLSVITFDNMGKCQLLATTVTNSWDIEYIMNSYDNAVLQGIDYAMTPFLNKRNGIIEVKTLPLYDMTLRYGVLLLEIQGVAILKKEYNRYFELLLILVKLELYKQMTVPLIDYVYQLPDRRVLLDCLNKVAPSEYSNTTLGIIQIFNIDYFYKEYGPIYEEKMMHRIVLALKNLFETIFYIAKGVYAVIIHKNIVDCVEEFEDLPAEIFKVEGMLTSASILSTIGEDPAYLLYLMEKYLIDAKEDTFRMMRYQSNEDRQSPFIDTVEFKQENDDIERKKSQEETVESKVEEQSKDDFDEYSSDVSEEILSVNEEQFSENEEMKEPTHEEDHEEDLDMFADMEDYFNVGFMSQAVGED